MFGVHRIYDFAAFCLPWSGLGFCPWCRCCRSGYSWSWLRNPASW